MRPIDSSDEFRASNKKNNEQLFPAGRNAKLPSAVQLQGQAGQLLAGPSIACASPIRCAR
jgi:hypothetical protein